MLNLHFIASSMKYFYTFLFILFCVAIAKSEVKVEISKSEINFGEVPYCKKITDTIVVKNSSTSTGNLKLLVGEKIIGPNSKNFRITNPKIKDLDLPPYDGTNSVIYVVEFDAAIQPFGDKSATLLIPNDSKDSLIQIPITGKSVMMEYEISPSTIDFQDISINQDYYTNLDITIKSNLSGKISSLFWDNPKNLDIDATGSKDLNPNTKRTFPVKIRLDKLGTFSGKIEIRISEPCDTTFTIPVKANAPNGFIQGFKPIDFGLVSECENKSDNFELVFTGFGAGTINSIDIDGDGKENIQVSFDQVLPVQFTNNGAKAICTINYVGNSKNYGKKQVTLKFNAEINAELKQYIVNVDYELGEIKLLSNTLSINYPDTYPNQTSSQNLEIQNNSLFDIQIDKIDFICANNSAYSIQPNNTPMSIAKGGKQDFQINFNPQLQNTDYPCQMEISYSSHNCSGILTINLTAKSLSKANLTLSFANLQNIEIDPKAKSLTLPIAINTTEGEIVINDTLTFDVVYPRSILFFDKLNSNNTILISNTVINTDRKLTFRTIFKDTKISTQKYTLGSIEGVPLLGDITEGNIEFQGYTFSSNSKSYDITQATILPFKLIVCNEGEPRLLTFTTQNKSIIEIKYYNSSNVDITFNAIESGNNKIIISDIMGNIIENKEIETKSGNSVNIKLNVNNYLNGIYFITITTPSEIYSEKIMLIN